VVPRRRALRFWLVVLSLAAGLVAPPDPIAAESLSALYSYQYESDYLPTTPSVSGGAVGGFANPAAFATGDRLETAFWWNDRGLEPNTLDNWGFAIGHHLGFAFNHQTLGTAHDVKHVDDYLLALALGNRRNHFGLGYRWSRGGSDRMPREDALVLGLIERPNRYYSFGISALTSVESDTLLGLVDMGFRPLGSDLLTVFGDYILAGGGYPSAGRWGAGVEIRPLAGLHLGVKFRGVSGTDEDYRFVFNVGVTLGGYGFHVLPSYDGERDRNETTFLLRTGASYPSLPLKPDLLPQPARWVPINLEGKRITYQTYRWFEKKRVAWLDLARFLDALRDDERVAGVALNLAGTSMRPSIAWELHGKLMDLKDAGKEIVIHIDRTGMLGFAVASVADRLTLDPQGQLMLTGVSLKRTYLKGTLDKLGVGFQAFRYLRFKSAMEVFSRTDMSAADREQRQAVVDAFYGTVRDEVSEGRPMQPARFDSVVNDQAMVIAPVALRLGLVDALARWPDVQDWLAEHRGGRFWIPPREGRFRSYREEVWGPLPRIVVVYAVGECAMDTGIKGRATSAYLRELARDPEVAAVVLRVDSPGGDPLPSDLVAAAVRRLQKAGKPVIVSQGDVAASGGYWISMDGDAILTTPLTITGSIGVIAGWFWDDGIGAKLGLSADGVARGEHADLFSGLRFPLLGQTLPERPLDTEELELVRALMLELYDEFVAKVAAGRHLDEDRVFELAEGRVWMGDAALARGLVDAVGGLSDAIALAREKAGLAADAEVKIVEYPPRPLFPWPHFGPELPRLFGLLRSAAAHLDGAGDDLTALATLSAADGGAEGIAPMASALGEVANSVPEDEDPDPDLLYLRILARSAGAPVLVMPPGLRPEVEDARR